MERFCEQEKIVEGGRIVKCSIKLITDCQVSKLALLLALCVNVGISKTLCASVYSFVR